jgi:alanine-glyoxylate transaminase/serine-glyoxylate transaminase/serine-pyruvate transaminase
VLNAAGRQLIGHGHQEFFTVMDDIQSGLRYAFQTKNKLALAVSGTGHAGMEAAIVNLVEPGDKVLVLKTGIWGGRAKEVVERAGGTVILLEQPVGRVFKVQDIIEEVKRLRPALLFVTHGESSDGTCQPLEGIGKACRQHGTLLLVDTVASLGGTPFFMDKWMVDAVYSGSQKVLSCPPGVAPICFGDRARAKMKARKTKVQSFYLDMEFLFNIWGVDGKPRTYHHTSPINSLFALREGLAILSEEGLQKCWERHRDNAQLLWQGLKRLGLQLLVENEHHRLPTVTSVVVPPDLDWKQVTTHMMSNYGVEISGGLGPTAGKLWRIGVMGYNSTAANVQRTLSALESTLNHCRATPRAGL